MPRKRAHGEGSISQRKDGRWQGAVTVGHDDRGKQRRKTVYGATQREVREKLEAVKQQISQGTYTDTRLTVATYLERWLGEKQRHIKPSTLAEYKRCIHTHISPRIGSVRLEKLTPMQVQTFVSEVGDSSGTPTANKCRVVLYSAYKQALRWQLVSRNPVEAVDPLPTKPRTMTLWTPEQAAQFLDAAREHRMYALFNLDMATGLRRGELLGLRWQDIKGNALQVNQALVKVEGRLIVSTPKTSKGARRVALSPDVVDVLEQHRQRQEAERELIGEAWPETGLVFTSEVGTPFNPDNLKRLRHLLMDRAGVPHIRLHDLRHLHASMAIRNGADPKLLADRLGHARASFTLDVYTHIFEEQRATGAVSLLDFLPKREPEALN